MKDIDPIDNSGDPFTPGTPPTATKDKNKSLLYTVVIVVGFAAFAAYSYFTK